MRALTTLPLAVALAIVAAAALPTTSAQDDADDSSNDLVLADGHAEGRFVAFDVGADAVCGWTFEGQAVIDAMVGVGGNARTQGRSVVVDGQAHAGEASGSCGAGSADGNASDDGPDDAPADEDEGDSSGNTTGDGGQGNATGNASATATSSTSRTTAPARPAAQVQAHLHDNPSGIITLDLEAGEQVRLDFHEGLDVRAEGGKVAVRGDGVRASLFASGGGQDSVDLRVQGSSVHVSASADARVHFRMGDRDADREQQDDVEEHVDDGDVACEVFVSDDDEPHVVQIDGTNVVVSAVHTSVRVDLDIDLGGGSDSNATQTQSQTRTVTQTHTQTQTTTQTATRTTTTGSGGGGGGGGSSTTRTVTGGPGCGCAQTVIILDVDVTVLVLEDHDDLLVRLNGVLLAEADSVEDALTVEAGEDPEALVVVDQEQEVKVLLSLAQGQNQLSLERQDGESFETREPQRYSTRTTLGDDGFVPVNDVDVEGGERGANDAGRGDDASDEDGGTDVSVPGLGWVAAVAAVAGAGLLARRRLD